MDFIVAAEFRQADNFPQPCEVTKMAKVDVEYERSAAVLTIKDAAEMTPDGRKRIAEWLRHCAKALPKDGANYAPRFRARYLYRDEE